MYVYNLPYMCVICLLDVVLFVSDRHFYTFATTVKNSHFLAIRIKTRYSLLHPFVHEFSTLVNEVVKQFHLYIVLFTFKSLLFKDSCEGSELNTSESSQD